MQQVPCKFACLFRFTKARGISFQQLNFLKRMYIAQNKTLRQQAKLKAESAASPFPERDLLAPEKPVNHDVSPLLPPSSEKPVINEGLELTAVTGDLETVVETSSKKEKQWKEMKLNMDDLPGILARLSKIKLTALVVSTASAGFAMAPVPFDLTSFLLASLGTGLSSCAANSINQESFSCGCFL